MNMDGQIVVTAPMMITSRLMPGVKIGDGTLSVEIDGQQENGIMLTYVIDYVGPGRERLEYVGNDICVKPWADDDASAVVRRGVSSLLNFLGAEAEKYRFGMGERPEDGWIFNASVAEWAYMNDSEIQAVQLDMDEE